MSLLNNSQSGLTIVSDPVSAASHRIRLILSEKVIETEYIFVPFNEMLPEDLLEINPGGHVPMLLDRDLVLYDEKVISEYLDERFPHPVLMPIDPMNRARLRLLINRIESEWYTRISCLELDNISTYKKKIITKELKESVSMFSPLFKQAEFLISDSLSLLDCAALPILWRLQHFGISLPEQAARNIRDYALKMFKREEFENSLSDYEKGIRK